MARHSATDKTTTITGRVLRSPTNSGFVGSFFMTDDKGQKFFIAPSRTFAKDVVRHLVEGDKVEIATISNVKPEVMIYAHEVHFRNFDLTTTPPML